VARDESRTIRVRCVTWDQVEQFYEKKLKGDVLVVKMPVEPDLGEGVTLALGLPSGLVFALDGSVNTVGSMDTTGKWPVAMKMHGLTREVRGREANFRNHAIRPTCAIRPHLLHSVRVRSEL